MVLGMDRFPMWRSTRWQPSPTASGRLLDYVEKGKVSFMRATTIMHKVRQIT